MIVDAHGHIGNINMHPNWSADAAKISEILNVAGVDLCIVSSGLSLMYDVCKGNREVVDAVNKYNNLMGYIVVNPFIEESYKDLKYIESEKRIVGCKIHPDYHGFDLSSSIGKELIDRVCDFAPLILFHTSLMPDTQFSRAETICEFALRHKNNCFLSGHIGGIYQNPLYPYYINYSGIETIAQYNLDNVLVDTASFWIYVYPGVMDHVVKTLGSEKIVFGTDVPIQSTMQIRYKLEAINSLNIPNDEKENILQRNIIKFIEK